MAKKKIEIPVAEHHKALSGSQKLNPLRDFAPEELENIVVGLLASPLNGYDSYCLPPLLAKKKSPKLY